MAKKPAKKPRRVVEKGEAPGRGGPGGTERFHATEEQRRLVTALRSCGWPLEDICVVTKLPRTTLMRHFKKELEGGELHVKSVVSQNIAEMAMAGDKTMCIFFAKSRMGWKDRSSVGFEDEKGQPVNPAGLFTINITG